VLGNWHFKYGLEEDIHQGMQIEMLKYLFYFDKQKLCQKVFDSQSWNTFIVLNMILYHIHFLDRVMS